MRTWPRRSRRAPATGLRGEAHPPTQADVATASTFIRGATATAVRVDDLWFDAGSGTD